MDSTIAIPVAPSGSAVAGADVSADHGTGGGATDAGRAPRRRRVGWLAVLVFACLAALAIVTSLVIRSVVRDQEHRLLHERAAEVASTVTVAIGNLESSMGILSQVAGVTHDSRHEFAVAAAPLLTRGTREIGIARPNRGGFVMVAAVGPASKLGQQLSPQQASLLRRASASTGLVSAVASSRSGAQLGLAVRGADGAIVFEDSAIDPRQPVPSTPNSPYSELQVVLYATSHPEPSQLVLTTTTQRGLPGPVDRRLVRVGAEEWLLLTSSRTPLVGSFASEMPWIVLAAILFGALLASALVELLTRRRRYAMALVQERTRELEETLARQHLLEREHREARESAEKASRAKSEFLSRMSHELRTPLNAILGFGQLLELDELNDRQRENVKYILKGGSHLLELINEVLELARIEVGQLALSPEPVPLAETVTETIALVRPLATAQGITLTVDVSQIPPDAHVHADRQRLKQVMLNLLSNAIKYNRADGRVDVTAEEPVPGRVRISVEDTGIGINPDHLARVFEPFDRLGAESGEIEGTGLGLALSKRLIEAMGGSISFDSEPGRGSTFSLELNAAELPGLQGLGAGPAIGEDDTSDDQGKPLVILYIEDNLSNVTLVERILELEPRLELLPAMQGRLGLDLARQHHPDLIMLDLHLPDMGGEEVLRRLKSDPETSEIPVVVLSADASQGQIQRLLEQGASDYLTKPLVVQRFLEVVHAALGAERVS